MRLEQTITRDYSKNSNKTIPNIFSTICEKRTIIREYSIFQLHGGRIAFPLSKMSDKNGILPVKNFTQCMPLFLLMHKYANLQCMKFLNCHLSEWKSIFYNLSKDANLRIHALRICMLCIMFFLYCVHFLNLHHSEWKSNFLQFYNDKLEYSNIIRVWLKMNKWKFATIHEYSLVFPSIRNK